MNNIVIDKLKETDLPGILAIENLSFPSPWKTNQFINSLEQFYVAKIDNKVVGFIGIEIVPDEARISHIAVHPIYRRQGIGQRLITYSLQTPVKKFVLEVRESNIAAQNLYKAFGFKEVSRRKKYYNDNQEDALVMIYEKST